MKRDMELIRSILIQLEEGSSNFTPSVLVSETIDEVTIGHHIWLLREAGYLIGYDNTELRDHYPIAIPRCLTWAGHEFLAAARNDSLWRSALKTVSSKIGSTSVDVLLGFLKKEAMAQLGIPIT